MAVSRETLNLLAELIGGISTTPPPQNPQADMAKSILLGSQIDFRAGNYNSNRDKGGGGPSVVSRIFDVLSRPNYAIANAAEPILKKLDNREFVGAFKEMQPWNTIPREWEGLTGEKKQTFTKMFTDDQSGLLDEGDLPKPLRAAMGLTLDIGLDPTTYVGPGAVKGAYKGIKAVTGLGKASKAIQEAPRIQDVASTVARTAQPEQIDRTSQVLNAVERATSARPAGATAVPGGPPAIGNVKWSRSAQIGRQLADARGSVGVTEDATRFGLPEVEDIKLVNAKGKKVSRSQKYGADFTRSMRVAREQAAQAKNPHFYGQVQRAEQLVSRIADSSPQAARTVAPKPPIEKVALLPQEQTMARLVARQTASAAKLGRDKAFNPKQQLTLFRNLLGKTSGSPTERMHRAVGMMRSAEKYLESQGVTFKYWDGTGVKLTGVLDELGDVSKIGPELLRELENGRVLNPGLDQAVEAARARSAMDDAGIVKLALDQSTSALAKTVQLSGPQAETVSKNLASQLNVGLRGAGVSPAARSTAAGLFKQIVNSNTPPMQRAMNNTQQVAHDIMNKKATTAAKVSREQQINKAIEAHMGSTYREVATQLGNSNKVLEAMGSRFQAHYGYSALRPMAQDHLLSAQVAASSRSRVWRDVTRSTTPEARAAALSAAQHASRAGSMPPVSPATAELANTFKSSIENLFSSTGISDTAASMATRAAFTMDDINAELRRVGSEFQFTNAKVVDEVTKETRDFSKGVDWLKSWETAKLGAKEDAVEFLSKLETAAEKVSHRYALLDDVAARFSATSRSGPFRFLAADPRLAGRYFTKEAVVQVNQMNHVLKNAYDPKNPFIKFVDRVTTSWKSGVTIYAPSHHVRNFVGDVWLSWVAGVNNPKVYKTAGQIMKDNRGQYEGAINVERLVNQNAMGQAMARPGRIVVRNRSGHALTSEQVYIAAYRRGLLMNARSIEDIYAEPLMPKIFGGRVNNFASKAAEVREHYIRLAHFVDAIGKSKGGDLKTVLDDAAHTVRKWHPDGMDLTNFERKYLRRIFPFYSWQRKAMPLVLESMVMKPGKIVAYPKTMESLQAAMGIEGVERTDPFPDDQLFPSWIKEKGIGPIAQTGMGGIGGFLASVSRQGVDKETGQPVGGYTIANPSNPMVDLVSQYGKGNPLKVLGSSLHPAARVPMEIAFDEQIYTGIPVSYDPGRYAAEQIPGAGMLSRITNVGTTGPTKRGQQEGMFNGESALNYLTAMGLLGTGPYVAQGKREQQTRDSAARRKRREEFLKRGL